MSLTYSSYLAELQRLAVAPANDTTFAQMVPNAIDYAEQRIYRDLQLLATNDTDATTTTVANTREITLPTNKTWVTVDQLCVIVPSGATPPQPAAGTRVPLVPVSLAFVNMVWPSATTAAQPQYYAKQTDQILVLGPWPNATYRVEVTGTVRPAPLSPTNTSTWLSQRLPDLFVAASMIFLAGYQRDFGQQSDDPKFAQSWESQYQLLKASAETEEAIKKYRIP